MPPPKRPKLAPISIEQFLSDDEIQQLEEVEEIDGIDGEEGQGESQGDNDQSQGQYQGQAELTHKGPLNLTTTNRDRIIYNRRPSRRPNNRLRDLFLEDIDNPMTVSSWTLDNNCRNSEASACSSCILILNRDRVIYNQAHNHSEVSISQLHSSHSQSHLQNNQEFTSGYQTYSPDEPSDLSLKQETDGSEKQPKQETPAGSVKRSVTPTGGLFDFAPIKKEKIDVEETVNLFQFPSQKPSTVTSNFTLPTQPPPDRPVLRTVHPGKSIFSGGLPSTFTRSVSRANYYHQQDRTTTTTTTSEFATPRISASKFSKTGNHLLQNQAGTHAGADPVRENQLRILAATLTNRKKFLNKQGPAKGVAVPQWPLGQAGPLDLGLYTSDMADDSQGPYTPQRSPEEEWGGQTSEPSPIDLGGPATADQLPSDGDSQDVQKCQICSDLASGFHYGVWSCEGCKAFFKRSLQGPVDYVCPATNNCTIDKHRRKSCQACRFRKCLEVGMMKRRERRTTKKVKSPGSPEEKVTKKVRTPNTKPNPKEKGPPAENTGQSRRVLHLEETVAVESVKTEAVSPQECSPSGHTSHEDPSVPMTSASHAFNLTPPPSTSSSTSSPSNGTSSLQIDASTFKIDPGLPLDQPHPLVVILEENDLPPKICKEPLTAESEETEYSLLHRLIGLADMELVDVVNWAKVLPGFSGLELRDRIAILESCWMELLCIGAAWRSRLNTTFQVNFAENLHFNEETAKKAKMSSIVGEIWQISQQFRYLELSNQEFMLLRVVTMLNAESIRLSCLDAMHKIRQQYLEALHFECGRTLGKISESSCVRMAQILCILPFARQVSLKAITHLFNMHNQHAVPVGDLVAEMLVAQKELMTNEDSAKIIT